MLSSPITAHTTCIRQPLVFSMRFRYLNFQKSFRSERKKVLKMTLFWTTLVSHELVWLFIVKESQAWRCAVRETVVISTYSSSMRLMLSFYLIYLLMWASIKHTQRSSILDTSHRLTHWVVLKFWLIFKENGNCAAIYFAHHMYDVYTWRTPNTHIVNVKQHQVEGTDIISLTLQDTIKGSRGFLM